MHHMLPFKNGPKKKERKAQRDEKTVDNGKANTCLGKEACNCNNL